MAKKVADLLDVSLSVESERGKGSTFTLKVDHFVKDNQKTDEYNPPIYLKRAIE